MVYMDTTTMTTRTTVRPATVAMTTTTSRSTTTRVWATTNAVVHRPRTTTTAAAPVHTAEGPDPEEERAESPSAKVPSARTDYCAPLLAADVSWPKTKPGAVSRMPCPPGTIGEVDGGLGDAGSAQGFCLFNAAVKNLCLWLYFRN